jgi:hypothetical protein
MLRRVKGGVEGDGGRQVVERRKRYEGEGAWENRGMAQDPFYNSGNVWHVNRALLRESLWSTIVAVAAVATLKARSELSFFLSLFFK